MAVNTYSDLKVALKNRLDESPADSVIDDWIDLAEDRIARDLRVEDMEVAFSVTISGGVAAVPADFLGLKTAYVDGSPVVMLHPKSLDWVVSNFPTRSGDAKPHYIARNGANWEFGPYPDADYTVKGTYYRRLPALSASNESGWLVTAAPALIFYAALVEAADYYADPRMAAWDARYEKELRRVQRSDKRSRYGDAPLYGVAQ